MKRVLLLIVGLACAWAVQGANPGDEVIVVYNTRLPESKAVAEHYAEKRKVPANQVFGFALSTNEEIPRDEFRKSLQQPLADELVRHKLWRVGTRTIPASTNAPSKRVREVVESKIRYAVLCYGVPLKIASDPNLKEEGTEHLRPELRRNEAAVDSELALLPVFEQKLPVAGPLRNPVYSVTNAAWLHPTNGVLMVARLDGPSAEVARQLVDKALEAETNGLWGRAYFDLRNINDPNFKIGDNWIRDSAEICRRLGFETIVDENPGTFPAGFPLSQVAYYLGWYDGNVSGPFAQSKVEFMPGAFAYHLHSFSAGSLRTTNRFWVGPLLAKGATATMGCVNEPYLTGTPDLGVFTGRLFYFRFSFGEAACASQSVLSWQTTVVGDPLYRPFAKDPDQLNQELEQRHSPLLGWCYLRLVDLNLASGKPVAGAVAFLEELPVTKQSAVLSEKLADLYAALGKPSSAIYMYEQALKLDPSPMQRVRLRLTLGEKLVAANRDSEAYEDYQKLLEEAPDYPDKVSVYRRLLPLAQKLGKPADVEKYQKELGEGH